MRTISTIDWLVLAAFFVAMVVIGAVFARRQKTGGAFFGGDRSTPWWLAGVSYYMNCFSALAFVMFSAMAYKYGWVAASLGWTSAPVALVVMAVVAKKWRRVGATSPLDYLCERFGTKTNQAVTWLGVPMQVLDGAFKLLAIGTVAGLVVKTVFPDAGSDLVFSVAIAVSGVVITAYTFLGGFKAAVFCDFIQFLVILAVVLVLPFICLVKLAECGGPQGAAGPTGFAALAYGLEVLVREVPPDFFKPLVGKYDIWYLVTEFVIGVLATATSWSLVRRYSSLRSEAEIRKTGCLVACLEVIGPPLFYFPAFAARVFLPKLGVSLDLDSADDMNSVYAVVCLTVLPTGMIGLMLSAMFAATMSTLAGTYNAIANVLTTDVYRRFFNPRADERRTVAVGRLMTFALGVAVIGITLALRFMQGAGDMKDLSNRVFALMLPPMSLTMILGVLNRRMTKRSGLAALLLGVLAGFIAFGLSLCGPAFAFLSETVPMTSITIAATLLGAALGTLFLKDTPEDRASVAAFFERLNGK